MPLPSWDLKTKEPLTSDPEKYAIETELIYKYSPFKNREQLMEQFNKIESSSGKHMNVCHHVKRFILQWQQKFIATSNPTHQSCFCVVRPSILSIHVNIISSERLEIRTWWLTVTVTSQNTLSAINQGFTCRSLQFYHKSL